MIDTKKLIEKKKSLHLTFDELSNRSNIPKRTLEDIFSGRTQNPRIDTLKAIERALAVLYHTWETLSIKNLNSAASGVVFYVLTLIQSAGRGIRYLSAFPAASPWRPSSRRQVPTPRKPPAAFRFFSSISRKPARRASRVLIFPLSPLLRVWAPASGALALYYILQTYIIMYV